MKVWQADEADEYADPSGWDRTNEIMFTDLKLAKAYCERVWRKQAEKTGEKSKPSHKGVPDMFARPVLTVGPYPTGHQVRWVEARHSSALELHAFNSLVQQFLPTPFEVRECTIFEEVPEWV